MNKTKIAIVGAGVIGKRHLAAINATEQADIVAISDPFPAAEQLAGEAGVPHFAGTAEMLNNIQVDGVIVATPTEHHLQPALESLEAGVSVLVEKPVVATMDEATRLIKKSKTSGKHVLVGHQRRYYSVVHNTRELIQSGRLGQLVAVHGQWNVRKNDSYYQPDWRKKWQAGPVLTNLIHEIDALRYMCGEITSICAETNNGVLGFEKEDAAALIIRFASGALGTFSLSDQTASPWGWEYATGENAAFPRSHQNAVKFMGTKASLDFPNLELWHSGDKTPDWNTAMQKETTPFVLEDAYVAQIDHFCKVISGQEQPRVDAQDAAKSVRATLAVYESAETGRRVLL